MVVVDAEDVVRRYGETVALDGVSVAIEAGEIFCLIGPNGAGKTTLIRCVTGTTVPDGGSVRLLGQEPDGVARDRIGLLPQSFGPAPRLSARELVTYYAGLYDTSRDPGELLAEVGVDAERGTFYENLSGGEQRRVCVATAVVNDPDVLVLDEPTTGIDPAGRRAVWTVLERLRDAGTTILVTTHDMREVSEFADRVGVLSEGKLVASGSPTELISEFGGPPRLQVDTTVDPGTVPDYDPITTHDGVAFEGVGPSDIGAIVRALDGAGIEFDALRWQEPDLEDVYLNLTDADPDTGVGQR